MLRISAAGSAVFYLQYYKSGKKQPVRVRLGPYPDLSLANARSQVATIRGEIARGIDPINKREQEKAEEIAATEALALAAARKTFRELADEYLSERIEKPVNRTKTRVMFTTELFPTLGDMAIEDIEADDVEKIYRRIRSRGVKTQALHAVSYARAALNYAVECRYLKSSPVLGLKLKRESKPRERVLGTDEIKTFWMKLDTAPLRSDFKQILRLQLLLGARVGEVAGMARNEIDMEARTWTIPPKRSKNKRQHILPLPPLARKLIAERILEQQGRLLFPTKHGNAQDSKHIANGLREALPHFGFQTKEGEPAPFTSHDLRRTLATKLRELGFGSDVRDAILNHITAKQQSVTEAHYTHADLSGEMRDALTTWEGAIGDIIAGGDPFAKSDTEMDDIEAKALARFDRNKVVPLRRVS